MNRVDGSPSPGPSVLRDWYQACIGCVVKVKETSVRAVKVVRGGFDLATIVFFQVMSYVIPSRIALGFERLWHFAQTIWLRAQIGQCEDENKSLNQELTQLRAQYADLKKRNSELQALNQDLSVRLKAFEKDALLKIERDKAVEAANRSLELIPSIVMDIAKNYIKSVPSTTLASKESNEILQEVS